MSVPDRVAAAVKVFEEMYFHSTYVWRFLSLQEGHAKKAVKHTLGAQMAKSCHASTNITATCTRQKEERGTDREVRY